MESELQAFFYGSFEAVLNEAVLDRDYVLDRRRVLEYLQGIASVPCSDFVHHLINRMARQGIKTSDIPQFSDWTDGTEVVCHKILAAGDHGYNHFEIGKMLREKDAPSEMGQENKFIIACRKYGEGHAKLALSLGLLQECENVYFLSCIGQCWDEVAADIKARLYTRFILRTRFIRSLLQGAASGPVSVKDLAMQLGLSPWSIYRRHSNVVCLLEKLCSTNEYDFTELVRRIDIKSMLERA